MEQNTFNSNNIDAGSKIASFRVKQSMPYEFKVNYARIRAWEFYNECGKRDLDCYVSVGGLDSITLFFFLKSIGIDVPAVSVSSLEDVSIQKIHKQIGVISLPPAVRADGTRWNKQKLIQEFGFPVLSKEIARKIELLQNPTPNNKTIRHAIVTGETGEYGGFQKHSKMKLAQKWLEKFGGLDFHDKFGIFYKGNDALSFSGSINDSKHGFQNYESIKVFKTWAGTQEYVDADTARFEKIWNRKDRNLKIFTIPQAVKNKIFELRSPDRPYSLPAGSSKWVHQDIAVKTFLEKEHGILAMATGTGKTVTAMKIINKLFDSGEIRRVVITMYGNDLLDQWAIQIRENYKNKQINYHYASQKMMKDFVMHPDDSILILSRDARNLSKLLDLFDRLPGDYRNDTLFVFDEVHGAGSNTFVENLSGRLSPYRYRLGLSATPEREYDEAGNDFLVNLRERTTNIRVFRISLQIILRKKLVCCLNIIRLPKMV